MCARTPEKQSSAAARVARNRARAKGLREGVVVPSAAGGGGGGGARVCKAVAKPLTRTKR